MNTDITNSFGLTHVEPYAQMNAMMRAFNTTWHRGLYPPNVVLMRPYQGPMWIAVNNNTMVPVNQFWAVKPYGRPVQNTRQMPQSGQNKYSQLLKVFIASLQQRNTNAGSTGGTF